jgi:hypothetical protein
VGAAVATLTAAFVLDGVGAVPSMLESRWFEPCRTIAGKAGLPALSLLWHGQMHSPGLRLALPRPAGPPAAAPSLAGEPGGGPEQGAGP